MEKIIPNEDDLINAIKQLKLDHPEFGIKSVTNGLLESQKAWQVSEKRVKKLMQNHGLTHSAALTVTKSGVEDDPSVPVSFIDPKLDITTVSALIKAKMFDPVTGKGLVAATDIPKNTILFEESPFAYFPEWSAFSSARHGDACGLCAKPFLLAMRARPRCRHCDITYCSKDCRTTAWDSFHQIECTGINPAMGKYLDFCRDNEWQAAMGVARMYALLLLANEKGTLDTTQMHLDAFATVNQSERQAKETQWIFMEHPTRELWAKARTLLNKAYHPPPPACGLTRPLHASLLPLFEDEDTFLNYLGKFNINNQNGGMYLVQSHINHHCHPNVSIDHPQPRSLYRLAVRALRDIKAGEQLFETYVNPRWNKETRQTYLAKSYLFDCACERCTSDGPLTDELRRALRLRPE